MLYLKLLVAISQFRCIISRWMTVHMAQYWSWVRVCWSGKRRMLSLALPKFSSVWFRALFAWTWTWTYSKMSNSNLNSSEPPEPLWSKFSSGSNSWTLQNLLENCNFQDEYIALHIGSLLLRSSFLRSTNETILICTLQDLQGLKYICVESISE